MSGRDEILRRIKAANRDAPDAAAVAPHVSPGLDADPVELFAERVAEYQASVTRVDGEEGVAGAVAAAATGARTLAVARGLPDPWRPNGLELREEPELSMAELDAVDGAVTGCALAIAQTGSIVLDGGPAQGPRRLTLVPDLHVCVVRATQIVGTVPDAVAALGEAATAGRPLTFVSGPSATSDIELERVEGVHGPRTLTVIVVG